MPNNLTKSRKMVKESNYDFLVERLNNLNKKSGFNYKNLRKAKEAKGQITKEEMAELGNDRGSEKYSRFNIRRIADYRSGLYLTEFNNSILKGNFKDAKYSLERLQNAISYNEVKDNYSKEEKEKFLQGINRRIERGMNYLEKHPNDENIFYMKQILKKSKEIEDRILDKKDKQSGLEKVITIIGLASMVVGIAIGYPALTGNVIANSIPGSISTGAGLFLIGLAGVFLANKK